MKKALKKITVFILGAALLGLLAVFLINSYIKDFSSPYILTEDEAKKLPDIDCILILGAGIWGDRPSPMLSDRLSTGIKLYESKAAPKLLMSGDHGKTDYDEVGVMKDFAVSMGVPSEDVFMDHAGFSTYESMYRAREIFKAQNIIIVTQGYHMYRSVYVARKLGLSAYGAASDQRVYSGAFGRELREVIARNKDFLYSILKPLPKYLGEEIYIGGSGDVTND